MKPTNALRSFGTTVILTFCLVISSFGQEILRNNDVISLVKAGLSSSLIVDKIRSSKSDFDTSVDAIIQLKQAKVPDDVLQAMLMAKNNTLVTTGNGSGGGGSTDPNDPMSPHEIGIYSYTERNGQRKLLEMEPNIVTQSRAGGMFGTAMTYGILKTKIKSKIPGVSANLQLDEVTPVFYFYLNAKERRTMTGLQSFPASINQFQLIKFSIKDKGREVTVGKANAFGGKYGISDEYLVEFSFEKVADGIYRVTPKAPLANGEYGFYLLGTGEGTGATFFDFGIRATP